MQVLAIGNSLSRDATRYLHQIAKAGGHNIDVVGLAIGGCSLQLHYKHHMVDDPLYELWINGEYTEFFVSIREALLTREWDVIVIQQNSPQSVDYSSFQPFLGELVADFRKYCPKAKLALHETWMFRPGCDRLKAFGYNDCFEMYENIHKSCLRAQEDESIDMLLPGCTVVKELVLEGLEGFYGDDVHASLGKGRYAMALTWYRALTGASVTGNTFRDFDEPITDDEISLIQSTVDRVV